MGHVESKDKSMVVYWKDPLYWKYIRAGIPEKIMVLMASLGIMGIMYTVFAAVDSIDMFIGYAFALFVIVEFLYRVSHSILKRTIEFRKCDSEFHRSVLGYRLHWFTGDVYFENRKSI